MLLLFGACTKNDGYTITGTAEGAADGDSVFLASMQGFFSLIPLDTTIVKDGKFKFTGSQEGADIRFVAVIHEGQNIGLAQIILENAPIDVKIFADPNKQAEVKGGPSQELFSQYEEESMKIAEKSSGLWEEIKDSTLTDEQREEIEKKLDQFAKEQTAFNKKFILDHNPSPISDMLFGYNASEFNESDIEEILAAMKEKGSQLPFYKAFVLEREASAKTAVGQTFTDIASKTIDGKAAKVSDHVSKNKLTLIDFWASWCGPCMAEMPFVKKAYDQFHSKGFEVVGISLDNDANAWKAAVERLKLPWPQLSDLKGWESESASLYNVKAIPANILVSQDGKIVAKDLRGDSLTQKLSELLK